MKKGFTLIELLSVIIILGIILAIAIPRIFDIINNSKVKSYKENIERILVKSEQYIIQNFDSRPINIGDTTEIELQDLITDDYISTIKSPFNSNECKGYILVTKIDSEKYEYVPHINCYEDINNSTEDGLILHYTFDDFQEPTENVSPNPEEVGGTGYTNYLLNVELDSVLAPNNQMNGTKITTTSNGQARTEFSIPVPSENSYYTFSVYAKRGSTPYAGFFTYFLPYASPYAIFNLDTQELTGSSDIESYSIEKVDNDWFRISMTVFVRIDQTHRLFKIAQTSSPTNAATGTTGDYVYYWGSQVEKKSNLTPFVNGTRTGTVKDYSINNTYSNLTLTQTPTWVFDEDRDGGVYQFNGKNIDILSPNNINPNNELTISSWVKFSNVSDSTRVGNIIGNHPNSPNINLEGHTNGRIRFYWNSGQRDIFGTTDLRGDWHFVTVVRNKTLDYIRIYIDGNKEVETTAADNINISSQFRIGNDFRTGTGIPYNGYIDDVRIYNRALSSDEVKLLYDSTK